MAVWQIEIPAAGKYEVAIEWACTPATAGNQAQLVAADDRLPLDRAALDALLADPGVFVGTAGSQVQAVVERIGEVVAARPTAAAYDPEPIL